MKGSKVGIKEDTYNHQDALVKKSIDDMKKVLQSNEIDTKTKVMGDALTDFFEMGKKFEEELKNKENEIRKNIEIFKSFCENEELRDQKKMIDEDLEEYEKAKNENTKKFNEAYDIASNKDSKEGFAAYKICCDSSKSLDAIIQNKKSSLESQINMFTRAIKKQKDLMKKRATKIINTLVEALSELSSFSTLIQKRKKYYDSKAEEEKSHIANPMNPQDEPIISIKAGLNELIYYKPNGTTGKKAEKIALNLTVPKYSHSIEMNNSIFITGGYGEDSKVISNAWVIDALKDLTTMRKIAWMIKPKAYHTQVKVDPNVFLSIGGMDNKSTIEDCECYNIKENKWEVFPSMVEGKKYISAAACVKSYGASVYAFGGVCEKECVNTIEYIEWPAKTGSAWEIIELTQTNIPPNYNSGVFYYEKKFIIFGGGSDSNATYSFDPKKKLWAILNKVPWKIGSFRNTTQKLINGKLMAISTAKHAIAIDLKDNKPPTYEELFKDETVNQDTVYIPRTINGVNPIQP